MAHHHRPASALALLLLAAPAFGKPSWQPVTPADLAAVRPASDPDAPAMVLFWNIELDDREYPQSKDSTEYLRYKIFDPEKSASLTRLSELSVSYAGWDLENGSVEARLTLPNGQTRDFGSDSVKERVLAERGSDHGWFNWSAGQAVKEKYLAVSGLEPGSILDVKITRHFNDQEPSYIYPLQKEGVPVKSMQVFVRMPNLDDFRPAAFLLNGTPENTTFHYDKSRDTLLVTGRDLPALVEEPFSPPTDDQAVTLFGEYTGTKEIYSANNVSMSIETKGSDGVWGHIAHREFMWQEDAAYPEHVVNVLEKTIDTGATSQTEKARHIHDYVHQLYLRFLQSDNMERNLIVTSWTPLNHVLQFEKYPHDPITSIDFHWLEIALDRAAGLTADTVLLPDRSIVRFDPRYAADAFLPAVCTRVMVDGAWQFSLPVDNAAIGFGQLPWQNRGQSGLVAAKGPQQLIPIPATDAADSLVRNSGEFTLAPDGSLTGTARQTLTGEPAIETRSHLGRYSEERRRTVLARNLRRMLGGAEITIDSIDGLDDSAAPLVVTYEVRLADYAVVTSKRLIFKPSLFDGYRASPFAASTRRNDIVFPYHREEKSSVTLHLPEGYEFEAPSAPVSSPGKILSYSVSIKYARAKRYLQLDRDFMSNLEYLPAERYPALKHWHDGVARSDQHELVLVRKTGAAPAAAPPSGS